MPLIAVAPMMDYTDRHDRYFLRLISPHIQLYTEMITAQALMHGDVNYLLDFDPSEKYLVLQLGGSDPILLKAAAKLGEDFGYDEINLNVGCPSARVKSGQFGACLMLTPDLVADCISAMRSQVKLPVSVKCRIGVDHHDSYENLYYFISKVKAAGCQHFIIHARKAWLSGLSPKENREIPPLHYDVVYRIKKDFPSLTITINGGISTALQIGSHLNHVDGVMIGRAAYTNPYLLAEISKHFFNHEAPTRFDILQRLMPYISKMRQKGVKLNAITRHLLGLFHGETGARQFRRYLSQEAYQKEAGVEVLQKAISFIPKK